MSFNKKLIRCSSSSTVLKFPFLIFVALLLGCIIARHLQSFFSRSEFKSGQLCSCDEDWQCQLAQSVSNGHVAGKIQRVEFGNETKFLALGISTVYRKEEYLIKTLTSLDKESDTQDKKNAVVIIYLADKEEDKKQKQLELIEENFEKQLNSGFFQVIASSTPKMYPSMEFARTKRSFNDSVDRVIWRTKQVLDFIFLFLYSKSMAKYFLVLEDDVITSHQYLRAIEEFVSAKESDPCWAALQFTSFLGIGLLYRSEDLLRLIQFLTIFYREQPVDMLMTEFIRLHMVDGSCISRRIPSLFQHIGSVSTLKKKHQSLTDPTFNTVAKKYHNKNPSADILTNMKVRDGYLPEFAYLSTPGYFWGQATSKATMDIIFPKPLKIRRLLILSGKLETNSSPKHMIQNATVETSEKFEKLSNAYKALCSTFTTLTAFRNGSVDIFLNRTVRRTQCIRIRINNGVKPHWIIIREIQVFLGLK